MDFRHLACVLTTSLSVDAAGADTALRVILFPGAQNLPMWVAEERGFFNAEHLAVTLTPTPGSVFVVRSLLQGEQDIALAAFDNVVAYQEGAGEVSLKEPPDFFAFAGITRGTVRLVVHPSIARLADLRGKVLAVDAVNTGYSLGLRKILAGAGLAEDDYTLEPFGGTPQRSRALLEGKASAAMLTPPADLAAHAKGYRTLARLVDVGPYQSTVAFARRSWAATHRDALVRFARATSRAMDWIYDPVHRGEAAAIYRGHVNDATPAEADGVLAAFLRENDGFAPGARLDPAGMANALAIRSEYGRPRRQLSDVSRYIDDSIMKEALR